MMLSPVGNTSPSVQYFGVEIFTQRTLYQKNQEDRKYVFKELCLPIKKQSPHRMLVPEKPSFCF